MKRIQNTARNIFIIDDETTFGGEPMTDEQHTDEQPQTAAIDPIPNKVIAHPLRGLLTSALSLIASRPDMSCNEENAFDEDKDTTTRDDHLIPLYDDEEPASDNLSAAVSVLDSIADSLNGKYEGGQDDGVKAPLFLSAFKSRFLG